MQCSDFRMETRIPVPSLNANAPLFTHHQPVVTLTLALLLGILFRFSPALTAKAAAWTQIWGIPFYLVPCFLLPTGMTMINLK